MQVIKANILRHGLHMNIKQRELSLEIGIFRPEGF